MLTLVNLMDAVEWPLASTRKLLNRYVKMASASPSIASIMYFWDDDQALMESVENDPSSQLRES
jgi:hypothetical protein